MCHAFLECKRPMTKLFDKELNEAMYQLFDETIEAIQLAKVLGGATV